MLDTHKEPPAGIEQVLDFSQEFMEVSRIVSYPMDPDCLVLIDWPPRLLLLNWRLKKKKAIVSFSEIDKSIEAISDIAFVARDKALVATNNSKIVLAEFDPDLDREGGFRVLDQKRCLSCVEDKDQEEQFCEKICCFHSQTKFFVLVKSSESEYASIEYGELNEEKTKMSLVWRVEVSKLFSGKISRLGDLGVLSSQKLVNKVILVGISEEEYGKKHQVIYINFDWKNRKVVHLGSKKADLTRAERIVTCDQQDQGQKTSLMIVDSFGKLVSVDLAKE